MYLDIKSWNKINNTPANLTDSKTKDLQSCMNT